jgi:hypothetical protein
MIKKMIASAAVVLGLFAFTACEDDAAIVDENMTKAADNFEIERRIVMFNGVTDKYLLEVVGLCSIKDEGGQLEVLCKTGNKEYKKHFLGLSDNVSYFVEQGEAVEASAYHYRVTFKPQQILPDFDARVSTEDLPTEQP